MKKIITSILGITILFALIPTFSAAAVSEPEVPNASKNFDIIGAGATFPFPLIDLWRVEYNKQFDNVNLNYQSIGSGGGIKQHIEKTVNFAASDKPLKGEERNAAPGTLHIPETIGGVVLAYNIPEVPNKGLKLTGEIIADIFLDKITKWNDPRIVSINPDLNLPDENIISAHRSDGSGTTFVFTQYLSEVSSEFDEKVGAAKSVPWPSGAGAAGNEGVAGIIKTTPYSIGYVELAYAFQTGLPYAFVQNADGTNFIEPSLESISAASAGLAKAGLPNAKDDWSKVKMVNAPGSNSYPIATFTYLLLYEDLTQVTDSKEEAKAIQHMIYWMITEGQEYSSSLLYVPLSESVIEIGKQGLSQLKYDGDLLWDYSTMEAATMEDKKIPDWIKNVFQFYIDGQVSDSDVIQALEWLINNKIINLK